ncbi:MAG: hypothetical protein ACW967_07870 [Candidatus Hodarchaeales archaeon]|jgi:uncharacterized protein YjeT (DUF2065 family)
MTTSYLSVKYLFFVNAIVAVLYGVAFLLVPEQVLSLYEVTLSAVGNGILQLYGGSFLTIGLVLWFIKDMEFSDSRRGVVFGFFIGYILSFLVMLYFQLNNLVNILGWSNVLIMLVFSLAYGYFLITNPSD